MSSPGTKKDHEARGEQRLRTTIAALYRTTGGLADCEIIDFSAGGALIDADCGLTLGEALQLSVPQAGMIRGLVVAQTVRGLHIAFTSITPAQSEAIRRLVFARLCG